MSLEWRKSSYSSNGGDCVEVGWHKSSDSSNGSACVEVATAPSEVLVRDTKDRESGHLTVPAVAWHELLSRLS
ncbi:DUF397 domain-containing protein [Amycolatopsis sp. FDAARGOS 1241]|uniref:DUF397 domain-containing protein n=1 Tax=Amycolatopsis sp. FDAARGOS 1241 TaxID=2778070 RepID=UPI001950D6A9|nr:DUF397 domain-containing protein [Amycolatopsis sp. FDAARGOS 1241]QRP47031.1 DUF397 domain-containing protein [Amycolatopsis sp. FDAARGOS 1241]